MYQSKTFIYFTLKISALHALQITYPRCDPYPEYSEIAIQERIQKVWKEVGLSDLVENHEKSVEK